MLRNTFALSFFLGTYSLCAAAEGGQDGTGPEHTLDAAWYQAAALRIEPTEQPGEFFALNTQQDLFTRIDARGMAIGGPASSPVWETLLHLEGIRRGCSALQRWNPLDVCPEGNDLKWFGNELTVHYQHSSAGMRQNFIVERPPLGVGDLQVLLQSSGDLRMEQIDSRAIRFVDHFGSERFRYEDLHVWDACGTILDAFMSADPASGELVLHVDDRDANYPITVDPITTTSTLTLANTGAEFGWSVHSAGDLNGDGYSDVVVGAPQFTQGQLNEGAAFVYYGGPNGLPAAPSVILQSDQIGANFGWSVAHAGDVNGDGFSDLIVGAIYWESEPSQEDEGGVFAYYGSATGISTTPDVILQPDLAFQYMGWSIDGAGDLNGDSYGDIIIGSNVGSNGQFNEGLAWIYIGTAAGLVNIPAHRLERNQTGAQFGSAVAGAGDINGDGLDDVIIGAHRFDLNCAAPCDDGAVFIYYGNNIFNTRPLYSGSGGTLNPPPSLVFNSNGTSSQTGWSVAAAGDVNGDGYGDVIVGDWRDNIGGQNNEGVALVFHGSATGLNTTPATVIQNDRSNSWLGRSVSSAGDMNGDGYADIAIGASQLQQPLTLEGAVYIHLGGPSGISPNFFLRYTGGVTGALLGESVSVAGDINGDGYSDLVGGTYRLGVGGGARVYLGGTYVIAPTPPAVGLLSPTTVLSGLANSLSGASVANAGDVNGDGYSDVIIGAPEASSGQANEGLALVFYGSATGLAALPNATLEMNVAGARFGFCVATAGDVNGDGYADVIVGAPQAGGTGRAYVFNGGPAGISSTPSLTLIGPAASRFGHAVSTAGDVNGDGFSDVIIGAPVAGNASVHLGSPAGTIAAAHLLIPAPQAGSSFGFAVATAGDVNGSGFSDIIVGAPTYSSGQTNEGAAYTYYGSDSGLVNVVDRSWESDFANARFGASVAGVGDVNGDGYFEVLVGAPNWNRLIADRGAVFYYSGSATGLGPTGTRFEGTLANSQLGYSVAEGGDLNGDGYADFLVGQPLWTNGQASEGRINVFIGRSIGPLASAAWEPNVANVRAGWSVAGGGDVDGDGFSDALVGSPGSGADQGAHTVLRGNWSPSVSRPTRLYRADLVSPLATNALDPADGLYFGIGHLARSHMQRKPGRLVWEVVHEGQPFSTSPIVNSITNSLGSTAQSAAYSDLGVGGLEIREQVYKEPFFRRYKWRVRVEWPIHRSMDGQRFSRWFYGYASAHGDIGVLPVELLEFTGEVERTSNVLHWSTATESGTSHFSVERSTDDRNFRSIGTVAAAEYSISTLDYRFTDTDPLPELAYYRLRIQDLDGSFEYSPIIALQRGTNFLIHPNPVDEVITWGIQDDRIERARIHDALGRVIADVAATSGSINGGPLLGLTHGYYTLILLDGAGNAIARARFLKA